MNFLQQAMRLAKRRSSMRVCWTLLLAAVCAFLPTMALAAEGDKVSLNFSSSDKNWLYISLGLGVLALLYGYYLRSNLMKLSPGSENMQSVGKAIKEGALAYLAEQVKMMLIFVAVLAVGLYFLYQSAGGMIPILVPVCFIAGVGASYIAGYAGMLTAVDGNMRTAHAALTSYKVSLETAFRSGAVAGMVTVGMGLIGASLILLFAGSSATTLLIGFGFGGSLAALFMRVGGGIFTKAADVGADLVGKVEAGIPEDDPRNPATIADNVGDNVGDCAGMAADIFESYEVTLVAAIILGAATAAIFDQETWTRLIIFAVAARGIGIIASIIGIQSVKGSDDIDSDPLMAIRKGFYSSAGIAAIATLGLAWFMMGGNGTHKIVTSQFQSLETIQDNLRRDVLAFKSKIKLDKKSITDDEIVTEFQKSPKGTAFADPKFRTFIDTLMKADDAAPVAPVDDFRVVDFKSEDKVLSLTTPEPRIYHEPGAKPVYQTVKQAYAAGLSIFQLELIAPPPADAKTPPTPAQTVWIGPTQRKFVEEVIEKQFNTGPKGPKATIKQEKQVVLMSNPAGKPAFGVVGPIDNPIELQAGRLSAAFATESPEAVATMSTDGKQPTIVQAKIGVLDQKSVPWWSFAVAIIFGIVMAFAIELLTDYYVSTHKKPTQEVAGVSSAGPAPMIIQGFAYGMESSVFMVFAIVIALIVPLFLFSPAIYGGYILSFYGIALVGLGLLTTTGYVLAMDTFGPISDNAQGVFEMSGDGHNNEYGSKAVQRLDAAGNTTKALTKGFAIATAVVAAVALFHSYLESAQLQTIGLRLDVPEIFLGLLIGAAAPYLFSAFAINAVGRASFELINEVRRQFRTDPGIMKGTSKPDYARCVAIVTKAAQRELLGPGILAIALPAAVAFGFSIGKPQTVIAGQSYNLVGAQALGGFLAGAIASGQLLAVLLANSGGMWDNAKKLIEDGLYGGKGTDAHKAGVVCDTVGDPFKDTAGPALNPLIKVMNLVALLLVGVVIRPFPDSTLAIITILCVGALAGSIYLSKKGSLSSEMQKATSDNAAEAAAIEASGTAKKTLTVEELSEDHEA